MSEEFLWEVKYAPQNIEDVILPERLKAGFRQMAHTGEIPHMIFSGTPGLGKTTVAKVLSKQLGVDTLFINASKEGNIETIRNQIERFATTTSLGGRGYKIVILDEADSPTSHAFQPALRAFMTQYGDNCRFILTANFKNNIIEAIRSRCGVYDFGVPRKELVELAAQFYRRTAHILTQEGVEYEKDVVADIIKVRAPDWRRILGDLQKAAMSGRITRETVFERDVAYDDLFDFLKKKEFKKMRSWVVNNMQSDVNTLFRGIYDRADDKVKKQSIPSLILILADYSYKSSFVADQEVNMVAALTEIMMNVEFE